MDLIRSLSEDDKEGVMARKVLDLLWSLAHSDDAPTDIIEQAVSSHIKILDYNFSQVTLHRSNLRKNSIFFTYF